MGMSSVTTFDSTYSIRVDDASSTETYVGEASIGSDESANVWRIKKLVTSGTILYIKWADGNQSFDNAWSNRASLTYI